MSNYRIVSRSYPKGYWAEHGAEIIDTANEVHDDKWSFRESRQLLANGLRTNSLEATGGSVRQVWISGLTISLLMIFVQFATVVLLEFFGSENYTDLAEPGWTKVGAIIGLAAMSFSTRWPVMAPLAITLGVGGMTEDASLQNWLFAAVIAATCSLIAFAGTGRRAISPAALVVLMIGLVATSWIFPVFSAGILLLALGVASFLLVRFDGRLAAAASIYATFAAVSMFVFTVDPGGDTIEPATAGPGVPTALVIALVSSVIAVTLGIAATRYTRQLARI